MEHILIDRMEAPFECVLFETAKINRWSMKSDKVLIFDRCLKRKTPFVCMNQYVSREYRKTSIATDFQKWVQLKNFYDENLLTSP